MFKKVVAIVAIFIFIGFIQTQASDVTPTISYDTLEKIKYPQPQQPKDPLCSTCKPSPEELYASCRYQICPQLPLISRLRSHEITLNPTEKQSLDQQQEHYKNLYQQLTQKKLQQAIEKLETLLTAIDTKSVPQDAATLSYVVTNFAFNTNKELKNAKFIPDILKNLLNLVDSLITINLIDDIEFYKDIQTNPELVYQKRFSNQSPAAVAESELRTVKQLKLNFFSTPDLNPLKKIPLYQEKIETTKSILNKKIDKAKNASVLEAINAYSNKKSLQIRRKITNEERFQSVKNSITAQDITNLLDQPEVKQQTSKVLKVLKDMQKNPQRAEKFYASCLDAIREAHLFWPTEKQITQYESHVALLKNEFSNSILPRFSSHSRSILEPLLSKTKIIPPPTQTTFANQLNLSLQESEEKTDLKIDDKDSKKFKQETSLIEFLEFVGQGKSNFSDYITNDVLDFECEDLTRPIISGEAFSVYGGLETSWASVYFPEEGDLIFFHEFGHILSSFLADDSASYNTPQKISTPTGKTFQSIKECLSNRQKDLSVTNTISTDGGPITFKTSRFTEEDFADLVAAKVSEGTAQYFMCGRISSYKKNSLYSHTEDRELSHASPFFRVLNYESSRRELPEECRLFLKTPPSPVEFKDCWPSQSE